MNALAIPNQFAAIRMADISKLRPSGFKKIKAVYLIGCGESVKIGVSNDPARRIGVVMRTAGKKTAQIAVTPFLSNAHEIEASFKRDFRPYRANGEWFSVYFDDARSDILTRGWDTNPNPFDLVNSIDVGKLS